MKGAFLVGEDDQLFRTVARVLVGLGGHVSPDDSVAQLRDETGSLFTVYRVSPELEWEFREGPLKSQSGVRLPDMSNMKGLAIECRSEFQFVNVVNAIAVASATNMWVVDGDGVVWRASDVDINRIRL